MMRRQISPLIFILNSVTYQTHVPVRRIQMPSEQHFINKTDEMLEKFIEECEQEAAKLEVTVDYYLAEFV
tara:strand:- start:286 stop:495 length:210 start_codon:yes stop_codon:yes gene_type:complete